MSLVSIQKKKSGSVKTDDWKAEFPLKSDLATVGIISKHCVIYNHGLSNCTDELIVRTELEAWNHKTGSTLNWFWADMDSQQAYFFPYPWTFFISYSTAKKDTNALLCLNFSKTAKDIYECKKLL